MADVVLIKLESDRWVEPLSAPYGILYIAASLEKAGLSVKVFHEWGTPGNTRRIVEEVVQAKPLFVGFSCLTGPELLPTIKASRMIKETSSIPVVWGGVHPTMMPEQTLQGDYVDLVVLGEGEDIAVELALTFQRHGFRAEDLEKIQGIAFRKNGAVQVNPLRPLVADLDVYEPAFHLLDFSRYIHPGRSGPREGEAALQGALNVDLITSRGCPWRCGYCYHEFITKRWFRAHSAERVLQWVKALRDRFGVQVVNFQDANFFSNMDRAFRIVTDIGLPWTSFLRANDIARGGDQLIQRLKALGCLDLKVGAESGSQRVLDIITKDITLDQLRMTARLGQKYGIGMSFSFMAGIPGETWAEVLQTLDFMDELQSVGDRIMVNGPLVCFPFPGTPLYRQAVESGFELPRRTEDWNFLLLGVRQPLPPYADPRVRFLEHYYRLAWHRSSGSVWKRRILTPLKFIAAQRWKKRFFRFRVDFLVPRAIRNAFRTLTYRFLVRSMEMKAGRPETRSALP